MNEYKLFIPLIAALLSFSCSNDSSEIESRDLIAAEICSDEASIFVDLDEYTPVDLIWKPGQLTEGSRIDYKVLIDKREGDFTNPIVELTPLEGTLSVYITKKVIDEIWEAVSEDGSESAEAKWVVETSADSKRLFSRSQIIAMTKQPAPEIPPHKEFEIGMPLFVTGTGTVEKGQEMSCIYTHPFNTSNSSFNDGQSAEMPGFDYELFTRVQARSSLFLYYGEDADNPDGYLTFPEVSLNVPGSYVITEDTPETGFTSEDTEIYRIRINVVEQKILVQKINNVKLRSFGREKNANGKWQQAFVTDFQMEYIGNGTWTYRRFEIKWGADSFDKRYDTYKFCVSLNEDSNEQLYGAMVQEMTDSNPQKDTDAKYWALQTTAGGAIVSKGAFRLPMWLLSESKNPAYIADVNLHLNFENGEYYHHEFINETTE